MTMIDDPLDGVVVLRSHLEEMQAALRRAYGHHSARDLAENYREGRPNLNPSHMTNILLKAHNRIEGYLSNVSTDAFVQQ